MNILLISSIYPIPGNANHGTRVCHFFARDWTMMGYNVQSVHIQAVYPRPLYWLARHNRKIIAAKTGAVVYTKRDKGDVYIMDGVPVIRIPVFKPIPHGKFCRRSVKGAIHNIIQYNADRGFVPDYIIGHFPNPQIEIINMLKSIYPNAKTALVMHGDFGITKKVYGKRLPELMKGIDVWGFRNRHDKEQFTIQVAPVEKTFMCYSGVPESYVSSSNIHDYSHSLREFVYVGDMIERKYPSRVVDALVKAYPEGNWHINYVGDGQLIDTIREKVSAGHLEKNVSFLGHIPRDEIKEKYDVADCMVMISSGEAYGLVYLEAMARGCITIASRNEGFDGVIEDGVNGFLCEAGNTNELAEIISRINSMSPEERNRISNAALDTARKLTDQNAARLYINDVMRLTQ